MKRQRALIQQAAAITGKNVTEFLLDSACLAAERVLAEHGGFVLDDAAWTRLMKALDRPVTEKPRLKRLLVEPSVVEHS